MNIDWIRNGTDEKNTRSSELYKVIPELYTCLITSDFTVVYSPFLPGSVVLNTHAINCLQEFDIPRPLEKPTHHDLAKGGLLVPIKHDLRQIEEKQNFIDMRDVLYVWLHITNACNLDCSYCCLATSNIHMSKETGLKTVQAVFQAAEDNGFRTVLLKYAGGEPTLRFELIQYLHEYANKLASEKALDLRAVVLSNGTIWTRDMVHWLIDSNVGLVISLDGVGEDHDLQRPTKNGQGTFRKIEQNIDNIIVPSGIRPHITITITGRNAHAVTDAVAWAIERELPFRLNFYREIDSSPKYKLNIFEERQIIEGLRKAYQFIRKQLLERPVYLEQLLDSVLLKAHKYPCAAGQSYLVFTHTGQLAQCPWDLVNSKNVTTSNDPLQTITHGEIPVIGVDDKEECKDCIWRYRCAGGCPKETHRVTGRYDVKSPHCNIYKALLPEVLRLEGLRLLKTAGYLSN